MQLWPYSTYWLHLGTAVVPLEGSAKFKQCCKDHTFELLWSFLFFPSQFIPSLPLYCFSPFPVGWQLGWCQEAAAGRDAEESGRWEPPADPEGGAWVPEEHLQRGSYSSPSPFYLCSAVWSQLSYFSSFPQDIDSLPTTYLFVLPPPRTVMQMIFHLFFTSTSFYLSFTFKTQCAVQVARFTTMHKYVVLIFQVLPSFIVLPVPSLDQDQ